MLMFHHQSHLINDWKNDKLPKTTKVCNISRHSNVTIFTPTFTVTIFQHPIITISLIVAESRQQHSVIDATNALGIAENPRLVVLKCEKTRVDSNDKRTDGVKKIAEKFVAFDRNVAIIDNRNFFLVLIVIARV